MRRDHLVIGGSGEICGEMAACGKTDHGDGIRIDMPFGGMFANLLHRFGRFQQRNRKDGRFHGISQDESVVAGRKKLHCNRLGLTVGRHLIAAAGNHQHRRACVIRDDFFAVVKAISDELGGGAVNAGNLMFEILHGSILFVKSIHKGAHG